MLRRATFAAAMLGSTVAPTITARAQTPPTAAPAGPSGATPAEIVTALKAVAGDPPKVRATFAKGQCVRGTYTPSRDAAQVTHSPSFNRPSAVVARFSVGGGNPKVADNNKAVLRGLALRLGNAGESSTLVVESAPVHFAKSLDQMLAFLKVRAPGPDGKPDAQRVKAFSDANPETLNQSRFVAARPVPASFAGITYWGVHSFPATNAKVQLRFIKFKLVPVGGEITLTDDEAKLKPADFLVQDLDTRIAAHAVRFDVLALLGEPDDPTMDVTIRWPDEDRREFVRLGTIAITALDDTASCDRTIFNPAELAAGIGQPPDPMFAARQTAYAISLSKRRD